MSASKGGRRIQCPGCGALVKDIPGKPHKYIGANAGCWEIYGEILAKEYGAYGYPALIHHLTVDTYAVQHPGEACRQAVQSVNVHLASLYLILEREWNGPQASQAMAKLIERAGEFVWLTPPDPNGHITVLEVVQARNLEEHRRLVKAWAEDVWAAWAEHHHHVQSVIHQCLEGNISCRI